MITTVLECPDCGAEATGGIEAAEDQTVGYALETIAYRCDAGCEGEILAVVSIGDGAIVAQAA